MATENQTSNNYTREAKPERRVVITGIGGLTPLGNNAEESWKNAVAGKSGISRIQLFDPEKFSSQIAGEVKNFDPGEIISRKEIKKMDRFIQLALVAADEALKESGINLEDQGLLEQMGSFTGVGMGGLPGIESQHSILLERGPGRLSPFFIPAVISNLASGQISIKYQLKGPNFAVTSACASGAHALGEAANYIRKGHCKAMLAGGTEAVVCEMAVGGFASMKALSTRNEAPEMASRPFDQERDGFVIAEGCGMFVLEDYEYAINRGAKIYAEVSGYGASSDGYHMTNPEPKGDGAYRAMKMALDDARLNPEQIDYVNAHGTSTPAGDEIEAQAIQRLLGNHSKEVCVSSTKSMTGHALGAAGAIETLFCLKAIESGTIPPTINLDKPSENCDLDFVPHVARKKELKHVINNSFGFGGTNSCLVFSKV